ncbi:MAG: RNA methyltransferase [Planctomycetota bacterium]
MKGSRAPQIVTILVEPRDDANIGSVARALKNCGFGELRIVRDARPGERARWTAVHAEDVLDQAKLFSNYKDSLAGIDWLVAFTARNRRYGPKRELWDSQAAAAISARAKSGTVGFVFGPEQSGLEESHLAPCAQIFTIPAAPERPVYNLAQSVLLACHAVAFPTVKSSEPRAQNRNVQKNAGREEIDKLMLEFQSSLATLGFKPPRTPHDRTARILARIRGLLERGGIDDRDAAMWKGILARIRRGLL